MMKKVIFFNALLIVSFSFAQVAKPKTELKINPAPLAMKFNCQGNWKIVKVDLNVELKNNRKPQTFPVQSSDFLDHNFYFNGKNVKYTYRNKVIKESIIEKGYYRDSFIFRNFTGGFFNYIKMKDSKNAVLKMNNPAFFLFITILKYKIATLENEAEFSAYYDNLYDTFKIKGDYVLFYLNKID